MKSVIAAVVAAGMLTACATEPFSYLEGRRYFKAEMNVYPARILSVDGTDYAIGPPLLVSPGKRVVILQGPSAPGAPYGDTVTMEIDVKPCMRYYLVAVAASPITPEFTPKIDYVEPIGGCNPVATEKK